MSLFIFQMPSHRKSYKYLCLILILKEFVYLFIWCFAQLGARLNTVLYWGVGLKRETTQVKLTIFRTS